MRGRYVYSLSLVLSGASILMACRSLVEDDSASLTSIDNNWQTTQTERLKAREEYFVRYHREYRDFLNEPIGFQGIPAIILGLLSEIMPDRWGADQIQDGTGFQQLVGDFPASLHTGPAKTWELSIAALSCGSCHVGRVQVGNEIQWIIGAPNTRIDIAGYRHKLWLTVNDARFNASTFEKALQLKQPGWLFGDNRLDLEASETRMFRANTADILDKAKAQVNRYHTQIHTHLGSYTYRESANLLTGGVPGSIDAFGFTAALLLMPAADQALAAHEYEQKQREILPPAPPMIDIMSVWRQADRTYSQWDGSIETKLMRNLGAELGAIGSPQWVNFENAKNLTPFVADMPAPPYPFDVDMDKASRGQQIYLETCHHCHAKERFIELAIIGTDPNRARSLTEQSRAGLIKALREACSDRSLAECRVSDEQILRNRIENPGYMALPHHGLWARAPYLHNGSVPTLYHLLVPEERPRRFKRGSIIYDQEKVGFDWQNDGIEIDTQIPGYANSGHSDSKVFFGGHNFREETQAREDLLEYLKTL